MRFPAIATLQDFVIACVILASRWRTARDHEKRVCILDNFMRAVFDGIDQELLAAIWERWDLPFVGGMMHAKKLMLVRNEAERRLLAREDL
jgi:hypothetical protein